MESFEYTKEKQQLISNIQQMEGIAFDGQWSDFAKLWSMTVYELREKQEALIPIYNEKVSKK